MKKRHNSLLLAAISLIITICMCFSLTACDACDETQPVALAVPQVTVSDNGVASWTEVENAIGYAFKVNDGNEQTTDQLSVKLSDGQSIQVKAVGDGENFLDSEFSASKTYTKPAPQPTKLGTPVVTINESGLASWLAVDHATKYTVKIGNSETDQTELSKQLTDGQTIQVKAVGDGTNYTTGDYSAVQTYTATPAPQPTKLGTPVVTINESGLASWLAVDHATKYTVKIGETETEQTELSKQLTDGQTIQVKAVGDGTNYTTGDYSAVQTYTATPAPQPTKLGTPVVTIDESGLASWVAIENATKYEVKIGDAVTEQTELSKQLTDGQTIQVKAVGDGTNYTTGDYSAVQTYTATPAPQPTKLGTPVVTISESGLASWVAIENASGYKFSTDNGTTWTDIAETSKQLEKNQTIIVKAVSNSDDYTESDPSAAKSYIVTSLAATISLANGTALKGTPTADQAVWEANGITVTSDKANATTKCDSYTHSSTNHARFYKDSDLTVAYTGMVKAVFKCTANDKILSLKSNADYTVIADGTTITVIFDHARDSYKFEALAQQARLTSIDIYTKKVPAPLPAPENLKIDEYGVATWDAVENASGYAYQIGDGETVKLAVDAELKSSAIPDGAAIKVWAVGDGADYAVDNAAATETYTLVPETLVMKVSVNKANGKVSWTALKGAVKYVYSILDAEGNAVEGKTDLETTDTELADALEINYSIKIKAVGDGTVYLDSADVTEKYTNDEITLTPTVTVKRDGTVIITETNAVEFKYTVDEGETKTVVNGSDGKVTLDKLLACESGTLTKAITVKAIGNGSNIKDSSTVSVTYTAPVALNTIQNITFSVTFEADNVQGMVKVSWEAIDNATKYAYKLNDETTEHETQDNFAIVELNENGTFSVKAVGDGNNADDVNANYGNRHDDSPYSEKTEFVISGRTGDEEAAYTIAEIVRIMDYYKALPSKEFKVKGVATSIATTSKGFAGYYFTVDGNSKAFEFYSPAFTATLPEGMKQENLVNYTLTATGTLTVYNSQKELNAGCKIIAIEMSDELKAQLEAVATEEAEQAMTAALAEVALNENYFDSFTLPSESGKVTVAWTVDNENKVVNGNTISVGYAFEYNTENGEVTIMQDEEETTVTLTATFTVTIPYGLSDKVTKTDTRTFTIKIPADGVGALGVPQVTLNGAVASWAAVDNATGYAYQLKDKDSETWVDGTEAVTYDSEKALYSVPTALTEGQSIQVKAVGDGSTTLDSEWSEIKTYSSAVEKAVLTITSKYFNSTSYAANNTDHLIDGYTVTTSQIMLQSGAMQFQRNKGTLTVTGPFTKIEIVSTAGTYIVTAGGNTVTGNNGIYVLTGDTKEIVIKENNGATGKVTSITFYAMV